MLAQSFEIGYGRFLTASGRAVATEKHATVWMFDNKIDWVTRLECRSAAVRRDGWRYFQTRLNTRPSTCDPAQRDQASVQVRRVSLGDMETVRVSV